MGGLKSLNLNPPTPHGIINNTKLNYKQDTLSIYKKDGVKAFLYFEK